jgi:hypothetical protein
MRLVNRGQLAGNPFQQRPLFRRSILELLGLFVGLDCFPVLDDFFGRRSRFIAEDVGVTTNKFLADSIDDSFHIELATFFSDLRLKDDMQQEIAEFFRQPFPIAVIDGFEHLVGFFHEHRLEGVAILFFVPGATVRTAKGCHDFDELFELCAGHSV